MPCFERHVFVCTNERAEDHPRGSCKAKGSDEVRDALKKELGARGLKSLVRANAAGCLDQCEHGVSVVVYPEQVWYGGVTVADVKDLVEHHIIGGKIVKRLLQADQPHLSPDEPLPTITPPPRELKP
jgi:(2Fe-2S) ferredoxin